MAKAKEEDKQPEEEKKVEEPPKDPSKPAKKTRRSTLIGKKGQYISLTDAAQKYNELHNNSNSNAMNFEENQAF